MKFEEWFEEKSFLIIGDTSGETLAYDAWDFQEERYQDYLELIQELANLRPCKETSGAGHLVKKAKEILAKNEKA